MTRKQKNEAAIRSALRKKRGRVHPEVVADYIPKYRLAIPEPNSRLAYGTLTDESPYSEYAWAFLRRNRFYQRHIDRVSPAFDIDDWGYRGAANNGTSVGLLRLKHYKEGFAEDVPVEWWGIHSFRDQLAHAIPHRQKRVDIEWPDTQVALVFDIDPLLGHGTTAIDQQIILAKEHLHSLAKKAKFSTERRIRAPEKWLLRAQLRVADLLSSPKAIKSASDLGGRVSASGKNAHRLLSPNMDESAEAIPVGLSVGDILNWVPSYDLRKAAKSSNEGSRSARLGSAKLGEVPMRPQSRAQIRSRVSKLAVDAWDNIYNWHLLRWLARDDWASLGDFQPAKPGSRPTRKNAIGRKTASNRESHELSRNPKAKKA